jgi:hypothetical protein
MAPVNTFGSGLRVETNVGGEMVDNEEYIQYQNNQKHSHHPDQPWHRGYTASVEEALVKDLLEPKHEPVEDDPQLRAAINKDLKTKGIQ